MANNNDISFVSSKEILEQTNISRATLNNYIKLCIIPRPIVKKVNKSNTRIKKIGYFPQTVLDRIKLIKQMKKEGNSMQDIVTKLSGSGIDNELSSDAKDTAKDNIISIDKQNLFNAQNTNETNDVKFIGYNDELKLTISDVNYPAYLLNNNFEISWINIAAEKEIFHKEIHLIRNAESRNIFKLLLNLDSRNDNKNELIDFHMNLFKSKSPRNVLKNIYNGMLETELSMLEKSFDKVKGYSQYHVIDETYTSLINLEGVLTSYRIFYITFREGIFLIYAPEKMHHDIIYLLSNRRHIINELLKQCIPSLISFSVVVANLQDSNRICAELPPEEYFELINEIWKYMENSFKKYNGICGKHAGDGMVYYFLKEKNTNYIMNAILCSLELRDKMRRLNMEWKRRKGWFNELFLNIGINEGEEYFGTISDSSSVEFTALGDSVNCASRVSDFANYGAIWTTKNLINRLHIEERKKIRFGIRRKEQGRYIFIENIFARVIDMIKPDDPNYKKAMDIATLPITEITDIL